MKRRIVFLLALIFGFGLIPAGRVTAQAFKTLHNFNNTNDGRYADNELVLSNNVLYGTAGVGGSSDRGTVFALRTDGTDFTILHSFKANFDPPYTNSDGAYPQAGMILSGGTLYGTANLGGTSVVGMVFKVNIDGTGFTNLHSFPPLSDIYPLYTNSDGAYPAGGLILSGETLYGTTPRGGALGKGTVFAVNTDGPGFTNLHSFANNEGRNVQGELVLSGSTLYGTAYECGNSGSGTVFKLDTNGGGFTVVHSFTAIPNYPSPATNVDGAGPVGGLVISSNVLYGTTISGGKGYGSVFAVNTDGTGFTSLYFFAATYPDSQTNSGGAYPQGTLTLRGNTLYGTTSGSQNFGPGTVFAVNTDGTGFTTLHSFPNLTPTFTNNLLINTDGSYPRAGLLLSENTLYGTTGEGGSMGYGTVFSLSLGPINPPQPCDFVTGGGWITGTPSGAKANFVVAGGITNDVFGGYLTYNDHGSGMRVKYTAVTGYVVDPNDASCRIIDYDVTINGQAASAKVRVCDNGEPGRNDTFEIKLSNGYFAGGHLVGNRSSGGNIQLHECH